MLFETRVETKPEAGMPHFIASGESVAPIVVKSKLRDVFWGVGFSSCISQASYFILSYLI